MTTGWFEEHDARARRTGTRRRRARATCAARAALATTVLAGAWSVASVSGSDGPGAPPDIGAPAERWNVDVSTGGRGWWVAAEPQPGGGLELHWDLLDERLVVARGPGIRAYGRVAAGPDASGDGVRELLVDVVHEDGRPWLAVVDPVDGTMRSLFPRDPAAGDPWTLLAADRTGDGVVGVEDLMLVLEAPEATAAATRAAIERVLQSWGARVVELLPGTEAPLSCSWPCYWTVCPECLGNWCCRHPDGTNCLPCFSGGGRLPGGGNDPGTESPGGSSGGPPGGGGSGGSGGGAAGGVDSRPKLPRPCVRLETQEGDADDPAGLGERRCFTVVAPNDCAVVWFIEGPACFTDGAVGSCTGTARVVEDGDELCVRITGCGMVRLVPEVDCDCPGPPPSPVRIVAEGVDLDVDSDHDDPDGWPARDEAEETIEADLPGRIVIAGTGDADGDGIPAWMDGMAVWPGPASANSESGMLPVQVTLPHRDAGPLEIRVYYDQSPPTSLPLVRPARLDASVPPPGTFRLWTTPGARSRFDLTNGGDSITPGRVYTRRQFARSSRRTVTLWLEAVRGSVGDVASRLSLDVRLTGDDPDLEGAGACLADEIAVTAVAATLVDLRRWTPRPSADGEGVRLSAGSFRDGTSRPWEVAGAVADGASPVLVRFDPDVFRAAGLEPTLSIVRSRRGGRLIADPARVGTLHPIGVASGPSGWSIPEMPVTTGGAGGGGASGVDVASGLAAWVPPMGIARGGVDGFTPRSALLGDADTASVLLGLDVVLADGGRLGSAGVWLREPPLVRVHGILSGPSEAWGDVRWANLGPRIVEDVDWRSSVDGSVRTSHLGFEENMGAVALAIERAVRAARSPDVDSPRYAATRADVIGHSQGGVLVAWYAADLPPGVVDRPTGYPPIVVRRVPRPGDTESLAGSSGSWRFLDPANWNAGPINRFISIGSPFRGTLVASTVAPVFADTPLAMENLRRWANGAGMPENLSTLLWPHGNRIYVAPTCLPDLAEGGAAQAILGGWGELPARYPTGATAVQWLAIGTTWNGQVPDGAGGSAAVRAIHALMAIDPQSVPQGVADVVGAVQTLLQLAGLGGKTDVVVPLRSQFGRGAAGAFNHNARYRPQIAHSEPFGFLGETQLRSDAIVSDVRRALAQPPDDLRLRTVSGGLPGTPSSRSRFRFERLDLWDR